MNGNNHAPEASADLDSTPTKVRTRASTVLVWLVAFYGLVILGMTTWMYYQGDREWLATILLFGPRWLVAIPWVVLVSLAAVYRWKLLILLAAIGVILFVPFLGLCVHLPTWGDPPVRLRLLTLNVNEDPKIVPNLAALINRVQPDVVALQEANQITELPLPPPWQVLKKDEFVIASRWPARIDGGADRPRVPGKLSGIRVLVETPDRPLQLFVVHLFTPRPGLEAVLEKQTELDWGIARLDAVTAYRTTESELCAGWIRSLDGEKIILGDFNMPVESTIYRNVWSSFANAFSRVGWGFGFTKLSEVLGLHYGTRIDQVLFTSGWQPHRAWVADNVGSDHLPLVVELR